MQTIRADDFRGQRIRLSGWVKSDHAGGASLWMRIDGFRAGRQTGSAMLDFDNMSGRGMSGTKDWKFQVVVLEVPTEAATVNFGLILEGAGQAWVDDMKLEAVSRKVHRTGHFELRQDGPAPAPYELAAQAARPRQPENLDFEK